jgi:hypothetical protein
MCVLLRYFIVPFIICSGYFPNLRRRSAAEYKTGDLLYQITLPTQVSGWTLYFILLSFDLLDMLFKLVCTIFYAVDSDDVQCEEIVGTGWPTGEL